MQMAYSMPIITVDIEETFSQMALALFLGSRGRREAPPPYPRVQYDIIVIAVGAMTVISSCSLDSI